MKARGELSDLGEFGLIARIERQARRLRAPHVVLGIGDDAAIVRPRSGEDLVVTSDTLVENVHFRFATQAASTVGRRALAVNLSDLAAMGARPLAFTCALQAPPDLPLDRVDGLVRGLLAAAARYACPLVGGNVARARETSLAVTAFGAVARGAALRRSALRAGDRVFVTGTLGGAALALARSERGLAKRRRVPEPRLAAGRALARRSGRTACIDVSDGLVQDLSHLARASGVGIELDVTRVPRPAGFERACAELGLDAARTCLTGGEDYELLFGLGGRWVSEASLSRRLGVAVAEIGRATHRPGLHGLPEGLDGGGWRHF